MPGGRHGPRSEESIFSEALERSPAERDAFLAAACGADAALRDRVERLIRSHEHGGSFLRPSTAATGPFADEAATGTVVGPYKLLQQIGEGGMGTVFMAEQQHPVRRMVALKIIKEGMDSRQIIARFEAEHQALALMDHPNIAKVLDADTTGGGRPYFVMELVKGVPITKFCADNQLTLPQRLAVGTFARADRPGEVCVLDLAAGRELFRLRGHTGNVSGIAFTPDGRRIATVSARDCLTPQLW